MKDRCTRAASKTAATSSLLEFQAWVPPAAAAEAAGTVGTRVGAAHAEGSGESGLAQGDVRSMSPATTRDQLSGFKRADPWATP